MINLGDSLTNSIVIDGNVVFQNIPDTFLKN